MKEAADCYIYIKYLPFLPFLLDKKTKNTHWHRSLIAIPEEIIPSDRAEYWIVCPHWPMNLLDIQSWWEIPSIAHFCSLFRSNFDLPQFDIEELEFALLNDVADSSNAAGLLSASLHPNLLADLVFGLVRGSKPQSYRNRVNHSNYQSVLRELLQHHCEVK